MDFKIGHEYNKPFGGEGSAFADIQSPNNTSDRTDHNTHNKTSHIQTESTQTDSDIESTPVQESNSSIITEDRPDYSWILESKIDPGLWTAKTSTDDRTVEDQPFTASDFPDNSLEGYDSDPDKHLRERIHEFADLKGEMTGPLSEQQVKEIDQALQNTPENKPLVQRIANKVTDFMSLGVKPKTAGIDIPEVKDAAAFLSAIENGVDPKHLRTLAINAASGNAKDGFEYFKLTGDSNNNIYAEKAEKRIVDAFSKVLTGELDIDSYNKYTDKVLDNPMNVLNDVVLDDMLKSYIRGGSVAVGVVGGAALSKGATSLISKNSQLSGELLQKNAGRISKMVSNPKTLDKMSQAMSKIFGKEVKFTSTKQVEKLLSTIGKNLAQSKNASTSEAISKALVDLFGKTNTEVLPKAVEAVSEKAKDAMTKAGVGTGVAAAALGLGSLNKAEASPTGIPDNSGKMIDTKDLVQDRQETPYTGEDAVTIPTREGTVTVTPKEATIISEAEDIPNQSTTPSTTESDTLTPEIYDREINEPEMVQPSIPDTSFLTKAGDVIQAILGGRDLNNDRTITASEWYQSTIGKAINSIKSIPSPSKIINNLKNKIDGIGFRLSRAIPGVYDMNSNTVETIDKNVSYTKEVANELKLSVIDSLPNWTDKTMDESIKETVADVVLDSIGNTIWADSIPGITLAKMAGTYTATTIAEIAHLNGYDMSNDQKQAINFITTNVVGMSVAPISSIIRDFQYGYGMSVRSRIENKLGIESNTFILPENEEDSTTTISDSSFGSGTIAQSDGMYNGYRENAVNPNIATDYNRGLTKDVEEKAGFTPSDVRIKILYNNEPDYIRKAIDKVLKSFREVI